MSNHVSLAATTGVLAARLRAHLGAAGLTATVATHHPTDADTHGTFLHLYGVLPSPTPPNDMVPERTPHGVANPAPRLTLDLHYLVTFVGAPAEGDTERMAGAVMSGLHAFPIISPDEIDDFIAAQPAGSPLATSDLADQPEPLRITPLSASIDDLSRLWGMTRQPFHRLSVPYLVSPLIIEADVASTGPPPSTTPSVTEGALRSPQIRAGHASPP